jgi:hypothetical protein
MCNIHNNYRSGTFSAFLFFFYFSYACFSYNLCNIEIAPCAGMTEILGAVVRAPLVSVAEQLNTRLWGVEPWRIVAGTASVSLGKCSDVDSIL